MGESRERLIGTKNAVSQTTISQINSPTTISQINSRTTISQTTISLKLEMKK